MGARFLASHVAILEIVTIHPPHVLAELIVLLNHRAAKAYGYEYHMISKPDDKLTSTSLLQLLF